MELKSFSSGCFLRIALAGVEILLPPEAPSYFVETRGGVSAEMAEKKTREMSDSNDKNRANGGRPETEYVNFAYRFFASNGEKNYSYLIP